MQQQSKIDNPYYSTKKKRQYIVKNRLSERQNDDLKSQNSVSSNKSARELLFQRTNMDLVESRLSQRNMSENRFKNSLNNSRASILSKQYEKNATKSEYASNYYGSLKIKTASDSKNVLLAEIAAKLKNRDRIYYQADNNHSLSFSLKNNYKNRSTSSRNGDLTQNKTHFKESKYPEKKNIRTKLSKLQNLLRDIKRSNREALQVASRTNKTAKSPNKLNFTDFPVLQHKIKNQTQQQHISSRNTGVNINRVAEVTQNMNTSPQKLQTYKMSEIQQLAEQLRLVRQQLKQVRDKNQQLLSISQSRSNFDVVSQSSRASTFNYRPKHSQKVSHQISPNTPVQNNSIFDNSRLDTQNIPYYQAQNQNHAKQTFIKKNNIVGDANTEKRTTIITKDYFQPCFACGCICNSKAVAINNYHN